MISAVADATVPKICVVLRKAYGAGLYAMCGPGFEPDVTIALPQAMIAVMGAEAAVNAVFANKIAEKPEAERAAYVEQLREEYRADIDLLKLAVEPARRRGRPGRRPARRADPAAGGRGGQDRHRLSRGAGPFFRCRSDGDGEIGSGAFADIDSGGRSPPHPRRHATGRPRAGRARRRARPRPRRGLRGAGRSPGRAPLRHGRLRGARRRRPRRIRAVAGRSVRGRLGADGRRVPARASARARRSRSRRAAGFPPGPTPSS